jgi:hypothetical protein
MVTQETVGAKLNLAQRSVEKQHGRGDEPLDGLAAWARALEPSAQGTEALRSCLRVHD